MGEDRGIRQKLMWYLSRSLAGGSWSSAHPA